ncbi:MAG: TetR/AcrR family transcriptional regulator [Solirubrobacterales bacterium]|nr:TetR/AcrR family transcriptional regulator [Solirubrobacterales bacterium]
MATETASSSKRLPARARREQILDVTAGIVTREGFQAVTIQAVAAAAGISRPIVYEHFGDIDGLLDALVKREMAAAMDQVSQTRLRDLSEGEPAELMLESLSLFLGAVERHPETWRLVLMPSAGAPPSLRQSIELGRASVLEGLAHSVRKGLKPGGADPPDAELTASILSAISDEYGRLVLSDPKRYSPERLLAHARWLVEHLAT